MSQNYAYTPEFLAERVDYEVADKALKPAASWTAIDQPKDEIGFCSNVTSHLVFNRETHKVEWVKENYPLVYGEKSDPKYASLHDSMSSAMWLYRLACVFKPKVNFEGRDGYKLVWSAAFEHAKLTGLQVLFYEWKGGFTFGARVNGKSWHSGKLTKAHQKALVELLTMLLSPELTHPYDGTVAGSVA